MSRFTACRKIGIDAGHRVTNHESKCKNVHGHRYEIEAYFEGDLVSHGSEQGMVKDFGFIKGLLEDEILVPCDHHLMLWVKDPLVAAFVPDAEILAGIQQMMKRLGFCLVPWEGGYLYILDVVPTAENLARHWGMRVQGRIEDMGGEFRLAKLRVWETPNCFAEWENPGPRPLELD